MSEEFILNNLDPVLEKMVAEVIAPDLHLSPQSIVTIHLPVNNAENTEHGKWRSNRSQKPNQQNEVRTEKTCLSTRMNL